MRSLVFSNKDFQFIEEKYSDLYNILLPKILHENGKLFYPMYSNQDYDYIFDIFGDYIGDSLDSKGELSSDGLKLERIWDYADGAEEWH